MSDLDVYVAATRVRAEIFKPSGKWHCTAWLDYSNTLAVRDTRSGYIDPNEATKLALAVATRRGTSEVSTKKLSRDWVLVVFDPPNGFPVLVRGL